MPSSCLVKIYGNSPVNLLFVRIVASSFLLISIPLDSLTRLFQPLYVAFPQETSEMDRACLPSQVHASIIFRPCSLWSVPGGHAISQDEYTEYPPSNDLGFIMKRKI